jgi:membrane-bound PQQ-dependent dehydrogenase (glucose/quinate/shikimate family)
MGVPRLVSTVVLSVAILVFLSCGAWLTAGGVELAVLGGSWFYVVAGLVFVVVAVLLFLRNPLAAPLYLVFSLGTICWALWESGFDPWALLARISVVVVLGLLFCFRPLLGRASDTQPAARTVRGAAFRSLPALIVLISVATIVGSYYAHRFEPLAPMPPRVRGAVDRPNTDWTFFGNTRRGDRFATADQITAANVRDLKVAWQFRSGDFAPNYETVPLAVGGQLFICTAHAAISLDADTGKQLWRFDPGADVEAVGGKPCRGVAYVAGSGTKGFCDARILWAALDDEFHALDAATGQPCPDFGVNGVVDLKENLGPSLPGYHFSGSPALVIGHAAILGASVLDNQSTDEPSGVVRAFDVTTGRLLWGWEVAGPTSKKSMQPGEIFERDTPNSWSVASADVELGLIYLPTGNGPPDYFGGSRRPDQEKYSSSIVALDAETGDVRWSFQTVHHDLWDMDVASQPVVADIDTPSGKRAALIAATKRGEIFLLDRRTGEPIAPVEERRVPGGPAPGDRLSPTQPYPVSFPSFSPPHLKESDMWGSTIFDQMLCRITFKQRRYEGQFTPPSTQGSIGYPDIIGVFNWGSLAFDPERQVAFVNASWLPYLTKLIPRAEADERGVSPYGVPSKRAQGTEASAQGAWDWTYAQSGTPYAVEAKPFLSRFGLPCNQPPWGVVAAIDLTTQKLLWKRPLGTTRDAAPLGLSFPMGVFNHGGSVVTRSGLAFISAAVDNYLRAFDIQTGAQLWQGRLPAGSQTSPMTFVSERSHRQYVLVSAGGFAAMGTKPGDYLVAFALPTSDAQ